ncbi:MAG: hypothetical protein ACLU4J_11715 [Butyricimonas paravirosa]
MDEACNQRLANVRESVNTYWLDKPLNNMALLINTLCDWMKRLYPLRDGGEL